MNPLVEIENVFSDAQMLRRTGNEIRRLVGFRPSPRLRSGF
jgi:hypothetical protein